jgi:hypothetical protein
MLVARLRLATAFLLGTSGCHETLAVAPPPPHPAAAVVAETPPASPTAPSPPVPAFADRCAAYQAESPAPRRFCAVTDHGQLWAVTVDDHDRAIVVHEDAQGHRAGATFPPEPDQDAPSETGEEDAHLFDFDGDGDPELFFKLVHRGYEDRIVRRIFVTARGGQVVPYGAAPPRVDELRDVDGDGRPDAVVGVEHGAFKGCNYCAGSTLRETFLAHARSDGSFSFTDEAARAFVRERCPARPAGPLVHDDDGHSWRNVACSRIWGVPRAVIVARLRAECASHPTDAARCEGRCRYLAGLELAAAFEPLTRLDSR